MRCDLQMTHWFFTESGLGHHLGFKLGPGRVYAWPETLTYMYQVPSIKPLIPGEGGGVGWEGSHFLVF